MTGLNEIVTNTEFLSANRYMNFRLLPLSRIGKATMPEASPGWGGCLTLEVCIGFLVS